MRSSKILWAVQAAVVALGVPGIAHAQDETVLIEPQLVPDYDRGRNVSVTEKARPDYDVLGIRSGAFLIYPRVELGGGATDNVYLTEVNRQGDVFAQITPSLNVGSDWSRHQLSLAGGATFRRYATETPANRDEWYLNALGRADFGGSFSITAEGQLARTQEAPFAGAVQPDVAALSSYERQTAGLSGQYVEGRSRITLDYDFNHFDFADVTFTTGATVSQADRDRGIHRVTVQLEHALSPSLSVYGQAGYAATEYDRDLLNGQPNRDSDGYRVILGVHFDLSAFVRGSVGVGYVKRNYHAPIYQDVSGPSVEAKVEYFPTELTTLTLNLRRLLDDSNMGATSAFFDNEVGLRVDHELLNNLLINASMVYAHLDYIGSPLTGDVFRVSGGGHYLVSRTIQIRGSATFGQRNQDESIIGGDARELAFEIGIVFQR